MGGGGVLKQVKTRMIAQELTDWRGGDTDKAGKLIDPAKAAIQGRMDELARREKQ